MNEYLSKRLADIVNHAYGTVPLYKRLGADFRVTEKNIEDRFYELPLVDKSMFQKNSMDAISDKYDCIPYHPDMVLERTSGSTGKYLKVAWQKKDEIMAGMELWKKKYQQYGITTRDKFCYFYTTLYSRNKLVKSQEEVLDARGRSLGFCKLGLTQKRIEVIYNKIFTFEPKWLMLQPSMAIILADYMKETKTRKIPGLQCVEVSGELLPESTRQYLEEVFACPVCNLYGMTEVKGMAMDFDGAGFRILKSNVYIEILGKNGNETDFGDIYVTSLNNYAMPFIRYATGDRGRISKNEMGEDILELERCRSTEFVWLEDGRKLPAYIFLNPIEHINEKIGNIIIQFQIVQKAVDRFKVRLALKEEYMGWKQTIEEEFVRYMGEQQTLNSEYIFEFWSNALPAGESNKYPYFISEIRGN